MERQMRKRRFQFRLVNWFWITLVVAAFFLGRSWDTLGRFAQSPPTGRFMYGAGVTSDAGVTGSIVVDQNNFSGIQAREDPK